MRNFLWIATAFSAGYLTHVFTHLKLVERVDKQNETSQLLMQTLEWMSAAFNDDDVSVEEFGRILDERLTFINLIAKD